MGLFYYIYIMLSNLQNIIEGLRTMDIDAEVFKVVEQNGGEIVRLQQEQLSRGIDKDGDFRVDEYRPLTKFIKQSTEDLSSLGRVTDRVTFFMYGNLYNSMYNQIMGTLFQVKSPLPTYDKMLDRINAGGKVNYGLSPDSRLEFVEGFTIPAVKKYLETKGIFVK